MNIPNTIRILPNIYLVNKIDYNNSNDQIYQSDISLINLINKPDTMIITINNHCDKILNDIDNQNNIINIEIKQTNINFNYTNELIVGYLTKFSNIVIISENNLLGFIIVSVFMIINLDVKLHEILVLGNFYSININYPNINYIDQINFFISQLKMSRSKIIY